MAAITALTINPAFATNAFDGKTKLICSVTDVVACAEATHCVQGQARSFDLPQFIAIDFAGKQVRSTKESGSEAISPINNQQETRNQLVLQGIENGHGWTLAIDRKHGRMTVGTTGEDASYILFGACIAP
jgi:rRNA processing protein Krr1/Pno1